MVELFSPIRKFSTWRELWIALAEEERALGLPISEGQISEMRAARDSVDLARAAELERELRHDVMAHVHAFAEQAPSARPIIHLGATSCYVTDNADLILFREALGRIEAGLTRVVAELARFAETHRALPCLGYTHFQPAQPVTVGKRACLWLQDLASDLADVARARSEMPFRGVKGTTGTQASFLSLFSGDHEKVRELDRRVTRRMGFERSFPVTGQTYPRKLDFRLLSILAGIGQSCGKLATDLRLLAHEGEVEEPAEAKQVGSSAMAYKRNPMLCERITSLARFLQSPPRTAAETAMSQWLERTLDDSAARRIVIPEAFLAADACLILAAKVAGGLRVHAGVIARNLAAQLPFLATEDLLMEAVRAGGDRQTLHERIRVHSREASRRMQEGDPRNALLQLLSEDPLFASVRERLAGLTDATRFVGRAPQQVTEFLAEVVSPLLRERTHLASGSGGEVRV
jgi:adenylosuccinate lyase